MFIVDYILRVTRSAVKIMASLTIVMMTSLVAAAAGRLFLRRRSSIEQRVWNLIMEQLGVEKVSNDASLIDDLGADSLDTVEVVMALEEEFGLEIPDDDAEKFVCGGNVGDLIKYVQHHID